MPAVYSRPPFSTARFAGKTGAQTAPLREETYSHKRRWILASAGMTIKVFVARNVELEDFAGVDEIWWIEGGFDFAEKGECFRCDFDG